MPFDIFRPMRVDILGRKKSKKQFKKEILTENKYQGRSAEESYKLNATLRGVEIKRSPKGQDFVEKERRYDPWTGKVKTKTTYVEIKSSLTAPQSKLQKKTGKKKRNYRVDIYSPLGF